jgi:hypothetical protein
VRIFSYLDDREITIEQDTDEIQEFIRSWSSSQERRKAIQRTRDAMHAKARNGYVAGGKVLGYTNVRDGSNVRRVVNAKEARLVARIFQLCAEGDGLLRIAKKLNEEGVANPTGQFRQSAGDPASAAKLAAHWSATGIREILHRRLYLGEVVYGQTRWERRGGTKRKVRVPESEWIKTTDPSLRLVSDDLWQAAHARLSASRAVYLTRNDGRPGRKPEAGLESKYLLSGFLRCQTCGGNMVITTRTGERGQPQVAYVCATHRSRPASCPVRNGLLADDIHARVVDALAKEIFTPERLQEAIARIGRQRAKTDTIDAQRRELAAERARLDTELQRLVAAVTAGAGETVTTLVDAMRARERARATVDVRLREMDARAADAAQFDLDGHETDLRAVLQDWHAMLAQDASLGRRALRDLLLKPILIKREDDGTWTFRLLGSFAGVIKQVCGVQVSDAAIEEMNAAVEAEMRRVRSASPGDPEQDRQVTQGTCPRGDSNTRHAV